MMKWLGLALLAMIAACGKDAGGPSVDVASVVIMNAPTTVVITGTTVQLVATVVNATGGVVSDQKVSWRTSDAAVATVSDAGAVTAVGAGPVTITAACGGKEGTTILDVRAAATVRPEGGDWSVLNGAVRFTGPAGVVSQPVQLLVRPATSVPAGHVAGSAYEIGPEGTRFWQYLTLTLRFDGTRLGAGPGAATLQLYALQAGVWTVVRGSTVDPVAQTVSGRVAGTGTYAAMSTAAQAVVLKGTLLDGALYVGQTGRLSATVLDALGDPLVGRTVTWSTSDRQLATVDATGEVTGVAAGSVTVTATVESRSASTRVTVLPHPTPDWTRATEWSMYQGDSGHSGYVRATADPAAFQELWTVSVGGYQVSPAAVGDGSLFVSFGSSWQDLKLAALDARTGSSKWVKSFGAINSVEQPAVGLGRVYVATGGHGDSFVWCLNPADGSVVFKAPYSNQWSSWVGPVVADSGVYKGGGYYGGMYRFDARTGKQSYFVGLPQEDGWTPAVGNGLVYTFGLWYTGGLAGLGSARGDTVFHLRDARLPLRGTPVLGSLNNVLAAAGTRLVSVDLQTRAIAWEEAGSFYYVPAAAGGVVYAFNGKQLDARRERDGSLIWTWPLPAGDPRSLALTDNLLFVSTTGGTWAIDLSSGRQVWSHAAAGMLALSGPQAVLYISRGDGKITAVALR